MSFLTQPIEAWTAADVERLIDERVEESQRLDYKQELKLNTKPERREAARDATGMANASGGLLIYGVEETELPDGRVVPKGPTPLTDHSLRDKFEDILDSTVSPRLRLEAAPIDTEEGFFLLVRVYERAGPLHMLEGYDEHRYYARRGASCQ